MPFRFNCQVCGVLVEKERRRGESPKYCGSRCKARARRPPTLVRFKCQFCGVLVERQRCGGPEAKFCSKPCSVGVRGTRDCMCKQCGKVWSEPNRNGQAPRYCSDECLREALNERRRMQYAKRERVPSNRVLGATRLATCKRCRAQWEAPVKDGPAPSFCSLECFKAARRVKNDDEYRRQANAKARAAYAADEDARRRKQERHLERLQSDPDYAERRRKYAAAIYQRKWASDPAFRTSRYASRSKYYAKTRGAPGAELFSLDYIFWRDKGKCHLCRKKVKREDASMDHLVPVSLGGEHTRANVALAHLSCNSRKKTKAMGEQLALFG
jgi:5-methylcytosine-specific restriction endonuclease McrA